MAHLTPDIGTLDPLSDRHGPLMVSALPCKLMSHKKTCEPPRGSKLKAPLAYTGTMPLNVDAGDSLQDVIWLSSVTTVRK